MSRPAAFLALVGVLATRPAWGAFHLSVIDEVMSGAAGNPALQFVEIRMLTGGQNQVARTRLTFFSCASENPSTVLLLTATNVLSPTGRWIMASPDAATFQTASAVAPDFTFAPGIDPNCGQVCWGAPFGFLPPADPNSWSASDPDNYIDCLAYGGYSGPRPTGFGENVSDAPGDGMHSLRRDMDGNFVLSCPDPTNNAGTMGDFGPCAPPATTTSTSLPTTTSVPGQATTTTTLPPGSVSGGPPRKTDCLAEWRVLGAAGTRPVVKCRDGDRACDTGDGQGCFFRAMLCFNDATNPLYNGRCAAGPVATFALTSKVRNTLDASNASAVLGAVAALGGVRSGDTVSFAPPIAAPRCTAPFNVTVLPKITGGKPRKGVRVLRTKTTAGKIDRDALRLICVP